MAVKEETEATQ